MGQLEKYGLYVMCLVIFLILGVSLWDVGEPPTPQKQTPSIVTEVAKNGTVGGAGAGGVGSLDLESLFTPTERPRDGRQQPKPAADGKKAPENAPADATASKGADRGGDDRGGAQGDEAIKPSADSKRPKYKIQDGDTLESVARARLGSAALHGEIQRLNPELRPTRLRVGQEIVLPSSADLAVKSGARTAPTPIAGGDRLYTVRKGDSLERIAGSQLGDKRRVEELRQLNPNVEDTKLKIGQSLKLPKQ